jgi:hypothetical protein
MLLFACAAPCLAVGSLSLACNSTSKQASNGVSFFKLSLSLFNLLSALALITCLTQTHITAWCRKMTTATAETTTTTATAYMYLGRDAASNTKYALHRPSLLHPPCMHHVRQAFAKGAIIMACSIRPVSTHQCHPLLHTPRAGA